MKNFFLIFAFIFVILTAFLFRFYDLAKRPMHTDEAVHAYKLGELIEEDFYRYNKDEYHGPTLNYLTLVSSRLAGISSYADLNEVILRSVPALFGLALVILPLLLIRQIGTKYVLCIILFSAVSHSMVFYSRYYIQEMLFVCFVFVFIVSAFYYFKTNRFHYAILSGAFLGLACATKETWIIDIAGFVIAVAAYFLFCRHNQNSFKISFKLAGVLCFIFSFLFVNIVFYSSFFANANGIIEAFRAYPIYFSRAVSDGDHIHPWHFYLNLLAFFKIPNHPFWSEGIILALGLAGMVSSLKKSANPFFRIIAFYTLAIIIIYSAIPYKTPWSMLSFVHGLILLCPVGISYIFGLLKGRYNKAALKVILALLIFHLALQSYLGNFIYYESPSNPYVYAHTSEDLVKASREIINRFESAKPVITVVFEENDYWPLPWYLRSFENVNWLTNSEDITTAPDIVICSADLANGVSKSLYDIQSPGSRSLYIKLFEEKQYRPGKAFSVYLKQ